MKVVPRDTASAFAMLHVVEIRFSGEHFRDFLIRVRGWFDTHNTEPTTFRYWFHEPETVLRINFEAHEQATAFAQAFGGSYWHSLTR
jgi:hypothetical protein